MFLPSYCIIFIVGWPCTVETFIIHNRPDIRIGYGIPVIKVIFNLYLLNSEYRFLPLVIKPIFFAGVITKFDLVIITYIPLSIREAKSTIIVEAYDNCWSAWK